MSTWEYQGKEYSSKELLKEGLTGTGWVPKGVQGIAAIVCWTDCPDCYEKKQDCNTCNNTRLVRDYIGEATEG